jgi:hypothetical protein
MFSKKERHGVWKGLAAGALGGAVASFAMNQFQAAASRVFETPQHDSSKKERARQGQGWKEHRQPHGNEEENATVKAAVAVADAAGVELPEEDKPPAGNAVHYAFGIVTGALYGAVVEQWPKVGIAAGAPFGAAVWLAADEIAVPAAQLSKPPAEYPAHVHAMALGSHLIYGLTTEFMRRGLRGGLPGLRKW